MTVTTTVTINREGTDYAVNCAKKTMKYLYHIPLCALLLVLLSARSMRGQESMAPVAYSGTEYLIAFPPSDLERSHQFMGLLITSESTTSGWIEIPDVPASDLEPILTFQTKPFSVRRGETTMIEIPRTLEPKYSDEASLRTVRLVSRAPVSVTVINARQTASGGYPVRPVDQWGTTYLPMTLPAPAPSTTGVTSQLLITALEKGTDITIDLSAITTFWTPGNEIRITLDAKQTYLLQANALPGVEGSRDLSGTYIVSNKPIGVVAGHVRAPLSGNAGEIFPTQTYSAWHGSMQAPETNEKWGTEYFTVPMRPTGDRFRLMARQANTAVRMTLYDAAGNVAGERTINLEERGKIVDVYAPEGLALNGPIRWTSNQEFSITQLRLSNGDNGNPANSPAMVRQIPSSAFMSRSLFALPTMIRGNRFSPFELQMIAVGDGNPFENITIDGTQAASLPNATVARITGNVWRLQGTIPTGSHSITSSGGVTFTGHVNGHNGAIGGVALAWELPAWVADIERDVTAPRVTDWNVASVTTVDVTITDSTAQYFSGVETIELYDSPGWEMDQVTIPTDPGMNAYGTFTVKNGIDPSGPLSLRLVDYDGNEAIMKVFDGVCRNTAYPDPSAETVEITVSGTAAQEKKVRINASPCGDEAHITSLSLDPVGSAYPHFEAPVIDGGSTPHTIPQNGFAEVTLRTLPNLPGGTYVTTLNLMIDGTVTKIPVMLKVEVSGVADRDNRSAGSALTVAPNPAVGHASLNFATPLAAEARVEITDIRGGLVRSFSGAEYTGARRIEWNGADEKGVPVSGGVYFVTLKTEGAAATERILLTR